MGFLGCGVGSRRRPGASGYRLPRGAVESESVAPDFAAFLMQISAPAVFQGGIIAAYARGQYLHPDI